MTAATVALQPPGSFGAGVLPRSTLIARVAGEVAAVIGAITLLGWLFDLHIYKSISGGLPAMKANTAIAFILCGGGLAAMATDQPSGRRLLAARAGAIAGATIGLLSLAEYAGGLDLGIDQLLFTDDTAAVKTQPPGRMSAATALAFVLMGAAILLLERRERGGVRPHELLALGAGAMAVLAALGLAYDVHSTTKFEGWTRMSAPATVAFLVLVLGVLAASPNGSLVRILGSRLPGGSLARILIPAAILVPALLGFLRLAGERQDLFGLEFGLALFASLNIATLFSLVWGASALANREGERLRLMAVSARESEERFRALFLSAPDPVIVTDTTGRLILANERAAECFGYTREELVTLDVSRLLPGRFADATANYLQAYMINPAARPMGRQAERYGLRRDGTEFPIAIVLSPIDDGNGLLVMAIVRDLTERRRVERDLAEYRDHLEELVAARTEEVSRVNKELEAFAYSVSHDLRTPLRAIDGFSQALAEDYAGSLDDQARDYISRVRAGTQRMGALIDDLLRLSRVSRAELNAAQVDLSEMAARICTELQSHEPERRVEINIAPGMTGYGDAGLLDTLLQNLIENAWKFTRGKEDARIEIGITHGEGEMEYFVRDNGAGFDITYADKLFQPFQRLHSLTEFAGSGIGLATVERIVRRHGGSVRAEGAVGEGATFYFTLPERTIR